MSELTLYLSRGACSMAAHIALLEAGAAFSTRHVDLAKGEHREDAFLQVNPRGQVPALKIGDQLLTENVAILTWIAKAFPEAGLLPVADLDEEAQSLSYLAWLSTGVHKAFGPLFHPEGVVAEGSAHESVKQVAREAVYKQFREVNRRLEGRDYALGTFGVADAYLFVFYRWADLLFKLVLSDYPNYSALYDRVLQRESVQNMLKAERELAEAA